MATGQVFDEMSASGQDWRRIEDFTRQLNSSLKVDAVLELIADAVLSLLEADRCSIFLYDAAKDIIQTKLARGLSDAYVNAVNALYHRLPGGSLIVERLRIVRDAQVDPALGPIRHLVQAEGFRSMLLVSMRHQDVAQGAFAACFDRVLDFDDQQLFLAQTLSNQAAVAIKNAQLYETAQRRLQELDLLRQVAVEINGQTDLQSTLQTIAATASKTLGAPRTSVYLYDANREELEVRAGHNVPDHFIGRKLKKGEGLAGRVIQMEEPLCIDNYNESPYRSKTWEDVHFGAILEAPLRYRGRSLGVLAVMEDRVGRTFDEDDMRLASLFSSQAAAGLASALLLEESQRRNHYLMALQRVGTVVTGSLDLSQVMKLVVKELQQSLHYPVVSIHRLAGRRLLLEALAVEQPGKILPDFIDLETGIVGRVVRTGRAEYIADVRQDSDYFSVASDTNFECVVPIMLEGEIWGALNVEAADGAALAPDDVPLLEMFSHQIAVAIRNARLYADSRQRVAELEVLRSISLQLSSSLDTQALVEAVTASAMMLVRPAVVHLYVYDQEQERFTLGAALSDTGERLPAVASLRPDGLTFTTLRQRSPLIINDAFNHPMFGLNPDQKVRDWKVTAIGGFPLLRPNGVAGVMTASFTRPFTFDESTVRLLSLLADQAAVAIENVRLIELEVKRRELADTLRQVAATVGSTLDFSAAASMILEQMMQVVPGDTASILLLEGDQFRLASFVGHGELQTRPPTAAPRSRCAASDYVATTGQALLIADIQASQLWQVLPGTEHIRSWLGAPLRFQGAILGTLALDSSELNAYCNADIEVVQAFADQTATALTNARLYEALQIRAEETERLKEFNERLLQNVEEGILLEGADDLILFVNPRFCEMLGYSPEELLGGSTAMLLTPEMEAHVAGQAARRSSGEKGRYEASLLRKDGQEVPVLISATPLFQNGVFQETLTVFTDITQRKRTEETLLALNAAAVAVRRMTESRQVYATVGDELGRLGLSSVVLRQDKRFGSVAVEFIMLAGKVGVPHLEKMDFSQFPSLRLPEAAQQFLFDISAQGQAHYLEDLAQQLAFFDDDSIGQWVRDIGAFWIADAGDLSGAESYPTQLLPPWANDLAGDNAISAQRWLLQLLQGQNAILVPLISQHETAGILLVLGEQLRAADLPAVEAFANQTSVALDNARLLAAERRERQRAETFSQVARILSATLDLDEALHQVLAHLKQVVAYDSSSLFLLRDGVFYCAAAAGFEDTQSILELTYDLQSAPILSQMMRSPQGMLIENTYDDPRWQRPAGAEHVVSWMGAPLVAEGVMIGVLMADKTESGYYKEEDLEVMAAFADQVSVAIQRARHYGEAQQRLRELASLMQVSDALNEAFNLDAVLDVVLASACDLVGTTRGAIALLEDESQVLRVVAARGQAASFEERINQAGLSLPADVNFEPEIRTSLLADPGQDVPLTGQATNVVLALAGQVIGLIELDAPFQDENTRSLLSALADLAAVAIDKARLYEETKERAASLAVAYEDLRQLDRMKDEFVQNVSHELRTPLTFIRGYVEYLLEGISGELNDEQRESLEIVLDRTDVVVRLVNDIISLKRAEMDLTTLEPLNLHDIAAACVRGARQTAEKHNIELLLEAEANLPLVLGDRSRLDEVFDNLIGNALKFSPDGGSVTVGIRTLADRVEVQVIDTGIGIPEDQLDKIWERFYQVDGTSTRRFGGTGLGLNIVKRIVEAHRGIIGVESTSGSGSTFYFSLPIHR